MIATARDLASASAAEQARLLRDGATTAPELLEAHLDRIARHDPQLHAFRSVLAERAGADAVDAQRRLDAGERAPLLGVPIAVKDNLDLAGERALFGTTGVLDDLPPAAADAEAIRRLRAAGAVVVGQTAMSELAVQPFTDGVRNPWSATRMAGGSSGGSAAAVAAGLVPAALGSDGGGSIRIPSAACGVFGLKPQRDRVPLPPPGGHWHGMTVLGPITRTVADAALMLSVLSGEELAIADPGPLTIATTTVPGLKPVRVSRQARELVDDAAALLRGLGHDVRRIDPNYPNTTPLGVPRYLAGVADDVDALEHPERLSRRTRTLASWGRRARRRMLPKALAGEAALHAAVAPIFAQADVLVTPMFAQPLPRDGRWRRAGAARTFLGVTPWITYTSLWNLTGHPAASVPLGLDDDGVPVAVQLVGRPHGEAALLAVAAQIERARPFARPEAYSAA